MGFPETSRSFWIGTWPTLVWPGKIPDKKNRSQIFLLFSLWVPISLPSGWSQSLRRKGTTAKIEEQEQTNFFDLQWGITETFQKSGKFVKKHQTNSLILCTLGVWPFWPQNLNLTWSTEHNLEVQKNSILENFVWADHRPLILDLHTFCLFSWDWFVRQRNYFWIVVVPFNIHLCYFYDFEVQGHLRALQKCPLKNNGNNNNCDHYLSWKLLPRVKRIQALSKFSETFSCKHLNFTTLR